MKKLALAFLAFAALSACKDDDAKVASANLTKIVTNSSEAMQ